VLAYDADGNVLSRATRAGQSIAFTYDTLNRLATKTPAAPRRSSPTLTISSAASGQLSIERIERVVVDPANPDSASLPAPA